MSEALFRVGAWYRSAKGDVVRLYAASDAGTGVSDAEWAWAKSVEGYGAGFRNIFDGRDKTPDCLPPSFGCRDLIPGELHLIAGQWAPITEQPRSPYFAESLEEKFCPDCGMAEGWTHLGFCQQDNDPNAAMIARDGPARPAPVVIQEPAKSLAHPAIAGLTALGVVDHRFGSFRF